jgi:hypothetical protein
VEAASAGLSCEAEEALLPLYDARCADWEDALVRALIVPAPDVAAFALKVVWAVDARVAELGEGEACLEALRGDAVRVLGAAG